jgi:hypothetical protein
LYKRYWIFDFVKSGGNFVPIWAALYLFINSVQWKVFKFEICKEGFRDITCRRVLQPALSTCCCRDLLTSSVPFSLHCVKNMDSCRIHHDKIGDIENRET